MPVIIVCRVSVTSSLSALRLDVHPFLASWVVVMYVGSLSIGVWGVGVATPMVRVDSVPLGTDTHSWVLTSEGTTVHNGEAITRITSKPVEGDVLVRIEKGGVGGEGQHFIWLPTSGLCHKYIIN